MLTIVAIMLCGIVAGRLLRRKNIGGVQQVITLLIWVLLFLLGVEVGTNTRIVAGLQTLGTEALVLTVGGCMGSAVAAWALWKVISRKKGGRR